MKAALAITAALLGAPLAAQSVVPLPGVADEETIIPSGGIAQYQRGKGDVLFVLDRAGRWYRVGLNKGCLSATRRLSSLAFRNTPGSQHIDRFTQVLVEPVRGSLPLSCGIESIRRSEAPPQINSKSRVTLD